MDLAEIRKKARLRGGAHTADQPETQPQPFLPEAVGAEYTIASIDSWAEAAGLPQLTEEEYALNLSRQSTENREMLQWLSFSCGGELYCLDLANVLQLIRPRPLTELPRVPDYLLGILSLRGEIVPVVDLARRLNLISSRQTDQQRVIVCSVGEERIGLLVDKVHQVCRVDPDQVESTQMLAESADQECLTAIGRVADKMLILLNPERIIYSEADCLSE